MGDSPLRALFLTVDEIEPGRFVWLIVEGGDGQGPAGSVASPERSFGTYGDALEAGVAELKRYSGGNLLIGPRQEDVDRFPSAPMASGFHLSPAGT
jgi:alkanesulfonate monooxygenase SsuD/methylene tetrahydromethanopterin reductase-like flavin-dependent oxidoreductase (luciferase family)